MFSAIERRAKKPQSSLSGPFGLGGMGLGAVVGAIAGNPMLGAQIGQQTGSVVGGVARPNGVPGTADKLNALGGMGASAGNQIQTSNALERRMDPHPPPAQQVLQFESPMPMRGMGNRWRYTMPGGQ